jgi:hypothetical protein
MLVAGLTLSIIVLLLLSVATPEAEALPAPGSRRN